MNAMQTAMMQAIPSDTQFPKGVKKGPLTTITAGTAKQLLVPIRYTAQHRKVKARQITRRIAHVNLDGTVVDTNGELWKARKLPGSDNLYEAVS